MTEQLFLWDTEPGTRLPPLRLVVYDVAAPKRLHRVARHCEDFGIRIQKSVFEMELADPQWGRCWSGLERLIEPEQDSICMMPLCRHCRQGIATLGLDNRPKPVPCWVV